MLCCVVSLSFICFCVVLMVKPPPLQLLFLRYTQSIRRGRKSMTWDVSCMGVPLSLQTLPLFGSLKRGGRNSTVQRLVSRDIFALRFRHKLILKY